MSNMQIEVQDLEAIQKAMEGQEKALSSIVEHLEQFNNDAGQFSDFQNKFIKTLGDIEKIYNYISEESHVWIDKTTQVLKFQDSEYPKVIEGSIKVVREIESSLATHEENIRNIEKIKFDLNKMFFDFISNINNILESKLESQDIMKLLVTVKEIQSNALAEIIEFRDEIRHELLVIQKKFDVAERNTLSIKEDLLLLQESNNLNFFEVNKHLIDLSCSMHKIKKGFFVLVMLMITVLGIVLFINLYPHHF